MFLFVLNLFFFQFYSFIKGDENKMCSKYVPFVIVLVNLIVTDKFVVALNDDDSCYSYGPGVGNNVYPLGSNTGSHQLQYTKAVSK